MSTVTENTLDPMSVVRDLAALPHRGAATEQEHRAADILEGHLKQLGATIERQAFKTPRTYLTEVWWLIGGLVASLVLLQYISWLGFVLVFFLVDASLTYFDWRVTPISRFPPQVTAQNVIGKAPAEAAQRQGKATHKLILMGHYDSAPVSMLYLPSMVKGFRQSLRINIGLILLSMLVAYLVLRGYLLPWANYLRWALIVYFLAQAVISSIDHWRYGYTNGAADNATGTAVAMATAARLWQNPIPGWDVEVVLTSAEEANMKGALAYYQAHKKELDPKRTFVLNFDNLGAGQIKVITCTGSLSNIRYQNALVDSALETAAHDPQFQDVQPGEWHTGDFDSIWFCRDGVPSLTLSAQDAQGLIPNLHRPTDTLDNVDPKLPVHAVDFAEATVRRLASKPTER